MTDTNPTRARYAHNKKAFDEVLGDPFAGIDGAYNTFKQRSTVGATRFAEGDGTANSARPTQADFFCDVENVIETIIPEINLLNKFIETYIVGSTEGDILTQAERNRLEQRIGRMLIARRITPVSRYFKTLRRGTPGH